MSLQKRWNIFQSYFLKKERPLYPTAVFVEPTNRCNLRCPICPHDKMTRPRGLMDPALFRKLVDEIQGRTSVVILHFMGESLIHPQIADFVSYAHENKLFVQLSSNGTLLTPELSRSLFRAGLDQLSIDFDGETPEEYETIRQNASFEKVLNNIRSAIGEKQAAGEKNSIILQIITLPGQRGDLLGHLSPADLKSLQVRRKFFNDSFAVGRPTVHGRPCFHLWNDMTIAWDGTVALCCVDYDCARALGQIGMSSVHDIWNGAPLRELRKKHLARNYEGLPLCATCSLPEQAHFNPLYVGASLLAGPLTTRRLMSPALNLLKFFRN